ncbi:MAG: hypothetical protein HC908_00075 [Calothrix sp. SM1_7_51]|nr:hypothetical protein [Calothrix sp. SM1_7_51]
MFFSQYPLFNTQSLIENTINAFSSKTVATKEAVEQAFQQTYQNTIAYSINNLLNQYPTVERILNTLAWTTNHPIISVIILIFILAILWSLIKAVGRIIERASWSLLRIPFQLIFSLLKLSFKSFGKVSVFTVKKFTDGKTTDAIAAINQSIIPTKQQRIAEITFRLEELQKEQTLLIKEVSQLIGKEL